MPRDRHRLRYDEIGSLEPARPRRQPGEHRGDSVERRVGDHPERTPREPEIPDIGADDLDVIAGEVGAESRYPVSLQLERDDPGTGCREVPRDGARPGAEIEHEVGATDSTAGDE